MRYSWINLKGKRMDITSLMIDSKLSSLENHGELGALLGLLELLLSLAELGKVEGGDLLSLLDLLLVGLDLALELGGELGHAVLVLLVLTLGEGELLGRPWRPLQCGTGWRPAQPQARGSCPRAW